MFFHMQLEAKVRAIPRIAALLDRLRVPRGQLRPSDTFRNNLISVFGATPEEADEVMAAVRGPDPRIAAAKETTK